MIPGVTPSNSHLYLSTRTLLPQGALEDIQDFVDVPVFLVFLISLLLPDLPTPPKKEKEARVPARRRGAWPAPSLLFRCKKALGVGLVHLAAAWPAPSLLFRRKKGELCFAHLCKYANVWQTAFAEAKHGSP